MTVDDRIREGMKVINNQLPRGRRGRASSRHPAKTAVVVTAGVDGALTVGRDDASAIR